MKFLSPILATTLFLIPLVDGAEVHSGIEIPHQKEGWALMGSGLLKKGFFFNVYVGALYVQSSEDKPPNLDHLSKRIDIHYFHYTPKQYMINVAHSALKKNLSEKEYNRLLPEFDRLHAAFLNGQKNSFASILHEQGKGLSYLFNDTLQIHLPGDDVANAYFSIWLGENPSSTTMKSDLLKGWNP